jgi:hypothetical protein
MEQPNIRIPRPPKGNNGQRPGVSQQRQQPKTPTQPTYRPVTIGDIYRQIAKPDIDQLLHTLLRIQRQIDRQLLLIFIGVAIAIVGTSFLTWSDLAQIRNSNQRLEQRQ